MENEEERKKAAAEAKKAKLETLEKKIASASADPESSAGKKHRFDDTEYLEESREIIDSVKSAVSTGWYPRPSRCEFVADERMSGLLKKKKKAKINHSSSSPEGLKAPSEQRQDHAPAALGPAGAEKAVTSSTPVTVTASA